MLNKSQLTDIVAKLSKGQSHQRAAWQRVIDDGRKYAQMRAHGTYIENGFCVSTSRTKEMKEMFKNNLLSSVEDAFAEDAQMGITVSEVLG